MAYGAYSDVSSLIGSAQSELEKQKAVEAQQGKANIQKGKMKEEFQSEIEAAQERAKKKAKKKGGLFKALSLAGMFLGPAGQAVTGALSGFGQAKQQRDAMKELMKGPQFDRYKNTFLGQAVKEQADRAKEMQQSSTASLLGGLMGGLGGFMGGKMLGGKGAKTGLFKGMKNPAVGGPMKQLGHNLRTAFDPRMMAERAGELTGGGGVFEASKGVLGKGKDWLTTLKNYDDIAGGGNLNLDDLLGMINKDDEEEEQSGTAMFSKYN